MVLLILLTTSSSGFLKIFRITKPPDSVWKKIPPKKKESLVFMKEPGFWKFSKNWWFSWKNQLFRVGSLIFLEGGLTPKHQTGPIWAEKAFQGEFTLSWCLGVKRQTGSMNFVKTHQFLWTGTKVRQILKLFQNLELKVLWICCYPKIKMDFLKSPCSSAHIRNPYPSILSLKNKEGRTAQGFIYHGPSNQLVFNLRTIEPPDIGV